MQDGVQLVRHDPQVRTVILKSSSPGIFCAGADLKERKEMTDREVMMCIVHNTGLYAIS